MGNRRTISWSTAMRDLRRDRARTASVREERLRVATRVGDNGAALSAWRGRSGRRYVVGVHELAESAVKQVTNAVLIAVRRDEDAAAHIVDVATVGARPSAPGRARWVSAMLAQGATELHIHRLAGSEEERRALIDDLRADADRRA